MAMDRTLLELGVFLPIVCLFLSITVIPVFIVLGWADILYRLRNRWLTLFSAITFVAAINIIAIVTVNRDMFDFWLFYWLTGPTFTLTWLVIIGNRWLIPRLNAQHRLHLVIFNGLFLLLITLAALYVALTWTRVRGFWTEDWMSAMFAGTSVALTITFIITIVLNPLYVNAQSNANTVNRHDWTLWLLVVGLVAGFSFGQFLNTYGAPLCSSLMVASPGLLLAMWRHGRRHDNSGD